MKTVDAPLFASRLPKSGFEKGEPFIELDELVAWLYGDDWVYLRDKPVRVEFIRHMTLDTVIGFVENGLISRARRVQ